MIYIYIYLRLCNRVDNQTIISGILIVRSNVMYTCHNVPIILEYICKLCLYKFKYYHKIYYAFKLTFQYIIELN